MFLYKRNFLKSPSFLRRQESPHVYHEIAGQARNDTLLFVITRPEIYQFLFLFIIYSVSVSE